MFLRDRSVVQNEREFIREASPARKDPTVRYPSGRLNYEKGTILKHHNFNLKRRRKMLGL